MNMILTWNDVLLDAIRASIISGATQTATGVEVTFGNHSLHLSNLQLADLARITVEVV